MREVVLFFVFVAVYRERNAYALQEFNENVGANAGENLIIVWAVGAPDT